MNRLNNINNHANTLLGTMDNNSTTKNRHEFAVDAPQFDLNHSSAYRIWRDKKLSYYPFKSNDLLVSIQDYNLLNENELANIEQNLQRFNMAIYSIDSINAITPRQLCQFAKQLGLKELDDNLCSAEDRISSVAVAANGRRQNYIPYTNKAISWHTDGYYNPDTRTIRSFILHCIAAADVGGENELLDPEIIYILLRDENPDYIRALMQQDVLTIPANIEQGVIIREQQCGSVFSIDKSNGKLHMRYTARTRSIRWSETEMVGRAVLSLRNILENNKKFIFKYKLQAGQGLLCNNVLHNRNAFNNDVNLENESNNRQLLRARYYNRIEI